MWASKLLEHPWPPLQWGFVLVASLAAARLDLRERRIPNALTGPLLLGGLVSSAAFGGLGGLAESVLATVLLGLPYVLLFAFAGGGAGDAKLMGAIGSWLGLVQGMVALFAVALTGVAMGFFFAGANGELRIVGQRVGATFRSLLSSAAARTDPRDAFSALPPPEEARKMPYGVAIFAGLSFSALGMYAWTF